MIHLIEGPVGAGKSTFAMRLKQDLKAPALILDDWMARLFSPDKPSAGLMEWYIERKDRCLEQIWQTAYGILETRSDVILELGLIRQSDRERFYDQVEVSGYEMKIYVLDVPYEERKERVQQRNRLKGDTYSMDVSDQVFEMASAMWESLDESECRGFQVEVING